MSKRHIQSVLLFSLFLVGFSYAKTRPTLALLDLNAKSGYSAGDAEQVSTLFRTRLISTAKFEVLEPEILRASIESNTDVRFDCDDAPCALALGKALNVEYIMIGTIAKMSDFVTLTTMLIKVDTENVIFASDIQINKDDSIVYRIDGIVEDIARKMEKISALSLAKVKAYIELEKYDTAEELLNEFERIRGANEESVELREVIRYGLANDYYEKALRLAKNFYFDDARIAINKAIEYKPKSTKYVGTAVEIKRQQKEYLEYGAKKVLDEIATLIEDENYIGAQALLEMFRREYKHDVDERASTYQKRIDKRFEEEEYYAEALTAFRKSEYTKARIALNKAQEYNPGNDKYQTLLERIERAEQRERENQEQWDRYFLKVKGVNPFRLFVEKKRTHILFNACYVSRSVDYRFAETLTSPNAPKQDGLGVFMTWHIRPIVDTGIPFFDVNLVGLAGMTGTFGAKELTNTFALNNQQYPTLIETNNFTFNAYAGVGADIVIFSYVIGLGVSLNSGFVRAGEKRRIPILNTSRSYSETYYTIGPGIDFWLGWIINEQTQLLFYWRGIAPAMVGAPTLVEKGSIGEFMISLGHQFF